MFEKIKQIKVFYDICVSDVEEIVNPFLLSKGEYVESIKLHPNADNPNLCTVFIVYRGFVECEDTEDN